MYYSRSTSKLLEHSNRLNTSSCSNKSRKSFVTIENRTATPQHIIRPNSARQDDGSQRVKLLLNNLIHGDSAQKTQLFSQSIIQKKYESQSNRGENQLSNRMQQIRSQNPSKNDLHQTFIEKDLSKTNLLSNLYYNKQSMVKSNMEQSKKKLLTLSQIAQQCKKNSQKNITPLRKQKINNENINNTNIPKQQFSNTQKSSPLKNQNGYLDTFHILKQHLNQPKQKNNEKVLNKDIENILPIILKKETIWYEIMTKQDTYQEQAINKIVNLLEQLCQQSNFEKLKQFEPLLIDTLILESQTCFLYKEDFQDHNTRNLIQYIRQSNIYSLQILQQITQNQQLLQNIEQRVFSLKKITVNANQTLKKNNCIAKSILEVMIDNTAYPEVIHYKEKSQQKQIRKIIQLMNTISNSEQCYTLVLDLDETLVHYEEFETGGGQFLIRPFAEEFIFQVSKYYEVIIFTAAMQDYANFILDILDSKKVIKQRLYRDKTICRDSIYIKDLSILNKDLAKVIIVDNMPENFQLQPENGIFIQSWMGDQNDRALKDLLPLLEQIAKKKCKDVRIALNQFREQMIERLQNGMKYPYFNLELS